MKAGVSVDARGLYQKRVGKDATTRIARSFALTGSSAGCYSSRHRDISCRICYTPGGEVVLRQSALPPSSAVASISLRVEHIAAFNSRLQMVVRYVIPKRGDFPQITIQECVISMAIRLRFRSTTRERTRDESLDQDP